MSPDDVGPDEAAARAARVRANRDGELLRRRTAEARAAERRGVALKPCLPPIGLTTGEEGEPR